MKHFGLAQHALGISAAIVILAGCSSGGSGAQLAPSGATQQIRHARPNDAQSWSYYNYNPNQKTLSRKQADVVGGTATFNLLPVSSPLC